MSSAAFSGGSGTVTVADTLFAKTGANVTLTVKTADGVKCVEVAGAMTGVQASATVGSSWTFATTAPSGDGVKAVSVVASEKSVTNNNKTDCTGPSASLQASYVVDNTGPAVTATLTPAPNAAGWNKTNTSVTWSATDAGAGILNGPNPSSNTVSANGITTLSSTATDRLGNSGQGSVTVRVDKTTPTITASQVKNPDGTTTVTFVCADPGGTQASGIATCVADGSATNSKTVGPGVTVGGTATDVAGNTATASATAPAGDVTPPTLTGAPTTSPNGAGWYSDSVTVHWTAADPESGIPTSPADTVIAGEGAGLTSTTNVANGAGLSTTSISQPAVNIDRTAPTTAISGTSNNWVNGSVTVGLAASDNLSGVARTEYTIDGGPVVSGSSLTLSTDGEHTITYRSSDKAGNVEAQRTATVKIDQTAPTISHSFTPLSYTDGAWSNADVTVTFACADQGGSGVASCTAPVKRTAEGSFTVSGTGTDGAGNTASDTADVRIDKTAPVVTAVVGGTKNAAGWYKEPVRVTYTAEDPLSGVAIPPEDAVLAEGANQSASASATDAAGNTGSTGVTGINVDLTAPELKADYSTDWSTNDVPVDWSCTDALSGVASAPVNSTVAGEGDNLSATASCTDVAGNTVTKTVAGIRIDRSAPTTAASAADPLASGWYGQPVKVTLTGADNLSGVVATTYTVNGGAEQIYTGPFEVNTDGVHTIRFWSRDAAGNVETAGAPIVLKVDLTAPTTTVINPISPASGWFVTSGIPVAFEAADAHSGVAATYYTIDGGEVHTYGEPFTADLSTGTHTITYWSVDLTGNVEEQAETNTISVQVDTDAPSISGTATPAANEFGWNNSDVAVTFTCADVGSGLQTGVAGCAGDTVLSNEGADQTVMGQAVDVAGNKSAATVGPIKIDTTKPTLVGVPADANAAGWYRTDVVVKWVGDDGLSGIDPASQPDNSIITGEGSDLGAGPVTIRDKAGNTSLGASVSGVKIDRTAPVIAGGPTTAANAAGWYNTAVTVDFSCTDALSGVASCPTSTKLSDDGAGQTVTSGPATDVAGNVSAGKTVTGINIDGTAPTTKSNNTCTAVNEWCKGDHADVVLTSVDQAGLSGVKEIRYRVDGGAEQTATGSSVTVSVPLAGSGSGAVTYYAVDNAGNAESPNSVALKWDNIAPTVEHKLSPAANAAEWNKSDVTVTFSAKDDDKGSGVASVTAPVTVSSETAGQVVVGTATDTAGNVGTDSLTVKLDKTAPTISGAVTSGRQTASGWYDGPVIVTFTCADALSGVGTCSDPVTLTANGAANPVTGTVTDKAGNTATATVSGIRIDSENPTLTTKDVNVEGGTFTLGSVPAATCTATDSFSGVASCIVTVTGGNANGVGAFDYRAVATDRAGNTTTILGTFRVVYRFDGFLQPINDTAHQVGASTSIFKAGSTVPVKFQLRNAAGALVQAATAPVWMTPVKGSATALPVDETIYSAAGDSGSAFRYDTTDKQYVFNWKTGSAGGNYWRIGVRLDDGQTYYVNIGLR
ncbi:hypothetical protein G5T42_01225 [Microbacterium sp. 4R-513]|uniref:OmpL47-type beta-barrel domain-containing protein n=1 Tax=Microbacterium sp. 4R-513 TaxID=2567934 RepID=UPI0013E13974|nr:PxKF domain-containing protein [Microbacterium sp. 4R-513]QIG38267.1 hypothetical protein G5T42_01225 [Microbacterium sp. 4R-513]